MKNTLGKLLVTEAVKNLDFMPEAPKVSGNDVVNAITLLDANLLTDLVKTPSMELYKDAVIDGKWNVEFLNKLDNKHLSRLQYELRVVANSK